jgi:Ca2+-transporting ATPase
MVGLMDPPRKNAASAIKTMAQAGIRTIMITGDQKDTAIAIAERLGLAVGEKNCLDSHSLDEVLSKKSKAELDMISVVSRATPGDKLRLIQALKGTGHIVAMTGDGINDAPALKTADIGVAMGNASADIAKEAADIVVSDGEYATLTTAVEEGRRIYANLQRATRFLILCSFSNIGLMTAAIAFRLPLAMTAIQLLWLNLVIHIFPAIALAISPNDQDFLTEPPRLKNAPIFSWTQIADVSIDSLIITAGAFVLFKYQVSSDIMLARTTTVCTLGLSLLAQIFPSYTSNWKLWFHFNSARYLWLSACAGLTILILMLYWPFLRELLVVRSLSVSETMPPLVIAISTLIAIKIRRRLFCC